MTEQEAIRVIKYLNFCGLCTTGPCGECERKQAKDEALVALEETQQYRAIGTPEEFATALENVKTLSWMYEKLNDKEVAEYHALQEYEKIGTLEECWEAREKQIGKKPIKTEVEGYRHTNTYKCPSCGGIFAGTGIANYCYHCGQALDWEQNQEVG